MNTSAANYLNFLLNIICSPRETLIFPCVLMGFVLWGFANVARADEVTLEPTQDNTIYENSPESSDGSGSQFVAGTAGSPARRALLLFSGINDSIPSGSTIDSVELTLQLQMPAARGTVLILSGVLDLHNFSPGDIRLKYTAGPAA